MSISSSCGLLCAALRSFGGSSRSGFYNLAGLDAAGANPDALGSAVDQSLDSLQIHVPAPPGYIVRVRDVVTELRPFAADVAYLCHRPTPNP